MGRLLEVKDLRTQFRTQDGVVNAVNGVSFTLDEGESLRIMGESGCGKSVISLSIPGASTPARTAQWTSPSFGRQSPTTGSPATTGTSCPE